MRGHYGRPNNWYCKDCENNLWSNTQIGFIEKSSRAEENLLNFNKISRILTLLWKLVTKIEFNLLR